MSSTARWAPPIPRDDLRCCSVPTCSTPRWRCHRCRWSYSQVRGKQSSPMLVMIVILLIYVVLGRDGFAGDDPAHHPDLPRSLMGLSSRHGAPPTERLVRHGADVGGDRPRASTRRDERSTSSIIWRKMCRCRKPSGRAVSSRPTSSASRCCWPSAICLFLVGTGLSLPPDHPASFSRRVRGAPHKRPTGAVR